MIIYQVMYNQSVDPWRFLTGYRAGDPLELVREYEFPPYEAVNEYLEFIWVALNQDDPTRTIRSLSVGDVVILRHKDNGMRIAAFSCDQIGWSPIKFADLDVDV